ncbi:hypothetical protein K4E_22030 [Enterococcus thailandicus]|nr:hypothetical protein K4E_22030 [Enterococcus thailandicus]
MSEMNNRNPKIFSTICEEFYLNKIQINQSYEYKRIHTTDL